MSGALKDEERGKTQEEEEEEEGRAKKVDRRRLFRTREIHTCRESSSLLVPHSSFLARPSRRIIEGESKQGQTLALITMGLAGWDHHV